MADQWYYSHNGNRKGPCSARQLREIAAAGQILPTDTIWKEGVEQGALASNVKNLFAAPPVAAAAPAPAAPPPAEAPAEPAASSAEDAPEESEDTDCDESKKYRFFFLQLPMRRW
jgi:ribosomal protein L12E/L44/L45/RPP1/RPP2